MIAAFSELNIEVVHLQLVLLLITHLCE
jgi:hypothetical protein